MCVDLLTACRLRLGGGSNQVHHGSTQVKSAFEGALPDIHTGYTFNSDTRVVNRDNILIKGVGSVATEG